MGPAKTRALGADADVAAFERSLVTAVLIVSADCVNRLRKTPASSPFESCASGSCVCFGVEL